MNHLLKPLMTEPCLEPPESFPPPKPKKSWKDMEITPELQSRHEKNMRMLFSSIEKHLEDSLKEREDQPLTER